MSEHKHSNCSPQEAAASASRWNAAMGAAQAVAAAATGNLGFINEAMHNGADAVSFDAKRRALQNPSRARKLRRAAVAVLAAGGLVGAGGGAYQLATGEREDARDAALAVAIAGAAINTAVARRTHSAHHDHSHQEGHGPEAKVFDAHDDSKLHALTDAGTGWLYVGGLLLERHVPGGASALVMLNGSISLASAGVTVRRIQRCEDEVA